VWEIWGSDYRVVFWSVVKGKCVKYGNRTEKLCDGVWLGECVLNMGI
jgi:hypothetical protein